MDTMDAVASLKENKNQSSKPRSTYYKCPQCPYQTSNNFRLVSHIQRLHPDEQLEHCDLCNYVCASKASLDRHFVRDHQNNDDDGDNQDDASRTRKESSSRPIIFCPSCDYSTRWNSNMMRHRDRHDLKVTTFNSHFFRWDFI